MSAPDRRITDRRVLAVGVPELQGGGVLCARGASPPTALTEEFGVIIVQRVRAPTWRCQP